MQGLTVATLMAGVFLILLGVLRLGTIIKYIPYPIVVGFTSGIAVTIFTTQIKDLFGMTMDVVPSDFIEKWIAYISHIGNIDPWSAVMGIASVIIIAVMPRFSKKVPGSLVAIIIITIAALLLKQYAGVTSIETIGDRFSINSQLPGAVVPALSWETIKGLVGPAVTIAVLGAIESLLSATVADGVIGDHHNSNTELIGQGIANIASPLFGGIPATGAIARTMTNINNGGRTPVAGIIHAVVLLLVLLFLGQLVGMIPMACLAAVLIMVAYSMSGWKTIVGLIKHPTRDLWVLLITFLLTVIFDLTVAIEVGILLALVLFLMRTNEQTHIRTFNKEIDPNEDSDIQLNLEHLAIPDGVEVYEIDGPYFFGIANRFDDVMSHVSGEKCPIRIIRMRKVPFVDSTAMHNLSTLIERSHREGMTIILSGVQTHVLHQLQTYGIEQMMNPENICSNIHEALKRAEALLNK
jgi:SulP family sulfate permease